MGQVSTDFFQHLVNHLAQQIELEMDRIRSITTNKTCLSVDKDVFPSGENGNGKVFAKHEELTNENMRLVKQISELENRLKLERSALLSIKTRQLLKQRELHHREIKMIKCELVTCRMKAEEFQLELQTKSNDFAKMSNDLQQKLIELMEQNQTSEKVLNKKDTELRNLDDKFKRLESKSGELIRQLKLEKERNSRLRNKLIMRNQFQTGPNAVPPIEPEGVENAFGQLENINSPALTDQSNNFKIFGNQTDHGGKSMEPPIVLKWPRRSIRRENKKRNLICFAKNNQGYYPELATESSNDEDKNQCGDAATLSSGSMTSVNDEEVIILSD